MAVIVETHYYVNVKCTLHLRRVGQIHALSIPIIFAGVHVPPLPPVPTPWMHWGDCSIGLQNSNELVFIKYTNSTNSTIINNNKVEIYNVKVFTWQHRRFFHLAGGQSWLRLPAKWAVGLKYYWQKITAGTWMLYSNGSSAWGRLGAPCFKSPRLHKQEMKGRENFTFLPEMRDMRLGKTVQYQHSTVGDEMLCVETRLRDGLVFNVHSSSRALLRCFSDWPSIEASKPKSGVRPTVSSVSADLNRLLETWWHSDFRAGV